MVASKYFVSRGPINLYIPHEYWMSDELDLIVPHPVSMWDFRTNFPSSLLMKRLLLVTVIVDSLVLQNNSVRNNAKP